VTRRPILRLLAVAAIAATLSCASAGYVPQTPSMPAARAALRPEYRIFYDALQDYGDWVLIEPYGFVFRPRVDYATFRPYADGFWAPSDPWGWVWISAEPFGWATYHYGNWFWDSFQGWVWTPGVDWGPAWVNWQLAGNYAGWAALPPRGAPVSGIPGGAYVYAPINRLGATDLNATVTTGEALGAAVQNPHPVENLVERDGVHFNAGPAFALVERARGGPLARVKIEEAYGSPGALARKEATSAPASSPATSAPAESGPTPAQAARAAANSAAREARDLMERGGNAPAKVPVVRVPAAKPTEPPAAVAKHAKPPSPKSAPPDSTY
jgi:hypothetical protein